MDITLRDTELLECKACKYFNGKKRICDITKEKARSTHNCSIILELHRRLGNYYYFILASNNLKKIITEDFNNQYNKIKEESYLLKPITELFDQTEDTFIEIKNKLKEMSNE